MADDLDDRLRAAMKTLDAEAPSGYFESLPEQLLAKLSTGDEVNMQQSGTPNEAPSSSATNAPPVQREEDSGLHDIRDLAASTKQRLAKRTTGQQALIKQDDDVLASSSASWKNLALPQPAAMVSLPELDELPSKQDIAKAQKAAAKEAKAAAKLETKVSASGVYDSATGRTLEAGTSAGAVEFKPAFSSTLGAQPAKKSNKRAIAFVGLGLAAAAGVTLFVVTQKNGDSAQPTAAQPAAVRAAAANTVAADKVKQLDEATAKLDAEHEAKLAAEAAPAPSEVAAAGSAATGGEVAAAEPVAVPVTKAPAKATSPKKPATKGGKAKLETTEAPKQEQKADTGKAKPAAGGGAAADGEKDKDFDALLKEAGVQDKKAAKPKLDKKELTSEDFKKGMSAITAKAQACYKGTQGSANVKLVIAPSGNVSKVTVSGAFAGKPEAECVSAAVKSASFPAWDGPPQSFGYPILLSE